MEGAKYNLAPLWYWMEERQTIYQKRIEGHSFPWTQDPILKEFYFCNVFREQDKVTRWIADNWRDPNKNHPNLLIAMCIARMINWPDTLAELPFPYNGYDPNTYETLMLDRQGQGKKLYTGAYMIRGGPKGMEKATWTSHHVLLPVWQGYDWWVKYCQQFSPEERKLEDVANFLSSHTGWGGFMSYEVVSDLRHTPFLQEAQDIYTWANPGPGAKRGLNRLLGRDKDRPMNDQVAIRSMKDLLFEAQNRNWPDPISHYFTNLEMRDIEHSLCEVDKYLRVFKGEGKPRSKYHPQRA